MSVIVKGLTKYYGDQKALDNVSFSLAKGEILGLLGPNGAGKTTTMKILTGFMPPSEGNATIAGLSLDSQSLDVKRKVGYLPEHNPLYGNMYVKEYLKFVAGIYKFSISNSEIEDLISKVGLLRESSKKISQLSKGYRQRVGIAQAIIHDPEVLILDEPISGLDPNQLIEIRSLISLLKEEKTIIFSSHILQEVESICDKVLILDQGRVVANDTLSQLQATEDKLSTILLELVGSMGLKDLASIENVTKVESLSGQRWRIYHKSDVDVREFVFDKVVSQGAKIITISKEEASLESVFKSVTD